MEHLPKISIVTPSFNQGAYIEATILSVLGQQYSNLEYIIIDGGSTDETVSIIKKYESQLAYWVTEKDKGQSHAINKGFEKATGDILMWLNSDDMLMPGALLIIAEKADLRKPTVYFGNCIHFKNQNGLKSWGSDVEKLHKQYALENVDYIIQSSSFWSKKLWKILGPLNEETHFVFDWEWFLKAKQNNISFVPLSECLSLYRIHSNHKSGTGKNKRDEEIANLYRHFAPNNVTLFKQLIEDKYLLLKRPWTWLQKTASFFSVELTDTKLLKRINASRYRDYSDDIIEQVKFMVATYD